MISCMSCPSSWRSGWIWRRWSRKQRSPRRAPSISQSDIGHLGIGAKADATIFHLEDGRFEYFDTVGERVVSDSRLVCDGLVIDGKFWGIDEESNF